MSQTAIALSGGAAHGDFEVGVVKYLYNRKNVKPDILCGTSVGAVAAVKLAEGEPANGPAKPDKDGHLQGLAGLEEIWNSLRVDSDMYNEVDLFGKLGDDVKSLLYAGAGTVIAGMALGPLGLLFGLLGSSSDLQPIAQDIKKLLEARSLANLNPLAKRMNQPASFNREMVKASKIKLRLAAVALEDGLLRYVTETGDQIERHGAPTLGPPEYETGCAAPLQKQIAQIKGEIKDLQEQINPAHQPGEPEGPAPKGGGLGSRITKLYQQLSKLEAQLAQCPKKQYPVNVGLLEAALASSSLPFIFPPQQLGDYWYVDGGVRMVTPIEAAIHAGADKIYAVACSQDKLTPGMSVINQSPLSSYAPPANLLDVGMRAASDIMPGEINDDQLYPPQGWGKDVIVIRSEYDIHDGMTIDPGLIRIRMAHGFMRADDTVQAYEKDAAHYRKLGDQYTHDRLTTMIVKTRKKIWILEFAANGKKYEVDGTGKPVAPAKNLANGPDAKAREQVRYWKRELKDMVDERTKQGGAVPLGAEDWWNKWEAHNFPTPVALWDAQNPFVPLKAMTATASPSTLVANKPVTFTVTALDADHKPVTADVLIDGKKVGQTGDAIHTTLTVKVTMKIDPKTHAHIPDVTMPAVTVYKAGYYTVRVDIQYSNVAEA